MSIGDSVVAAVTQTDDQKNEAAAEEIRRLLLHIVSCCGSGLTQVLDTITNAPGDKAAVMAKLGSDQTDAETLAQKIVTLVNDHQATADDDVSF